MHPQCSLALRIVFRKEEEGAHHLRLFQADGVLGQSMLPSADFQSRRIEYGPLAGVQQALGDRVLLGEGLSQRRGLAALVVGPDREQLVHLGGLIRLHQLEHGEQGRGADLIDVRVDVEIDRAEGLRLVA